MLAVELVDGLDDAVLAVAGDAPGIAEVKDGIALAPQVDTLEPAGEDAGGPLACCDGLILAAAPE